MAGQSSTETFQLRGRDLASGEEWAIFRKKSSRDLIICSKYAGSLLIQIPQEATLYEF